MAFGIAVLGAILQGSVGFGLGLLGVPLLVLIDPVFIPGPLLLAAFFLNLLISRRERMSIDFRSVMWAVPGRILGAIIGAGILILIPQERLSVLFGLMVLFAVGISVKGWELSPSPWNVFSAGTFSGFMGTTSAIGGAPMALVFQRQKGSKIRGTLSAIFAIGTVISMLSLFVIGRFGLEEIQAAIVLFPGIILGFFLSHQTARVLDRGFIRAAVLITSAASGFFVLLRNVL
jgi:uncharacterized membrane protein YfcA